MWVNKNSYEKGGWILHMLRKKLGDSLFWKGIRSYYSKYAGGNASTDDLRSVMQDVSQTNLNEFFQQWLYTTGQPLLQVSWKYNESKKSIILDIVQQQKKLFSFPLQFGFINGETVKNSNPSFLIKDRSTRVTVAVAVKPTKVILDPETSLLFDGTIAEKK